MIDVKNIKITGGSTFEKPVFGDVPEGAYLAELLTIYPWKSITRNTTQRVRDDEGKLVKDDDGNYIKEAVNDVTWQYTDVVFKIVDGSDYDGISVKGSLSTHPDMLGSAKRFLYAAKLFDVSLDSVKDNLGEKVIINVKQRTDRYKDKETGLDVERTYPYISYYTSVDDEKEEVLGI